MYLFLVLVIINYGVFNPNKLASFFAYLEILLLYFKRLEIIVGMLACRIKLRFIL